MFKKFFISALAIITMSSQVHASALDGLKTAYEDLNYNLTSVWDQKDQNFLNSQSEKFSKDLQTLKSEGLTNEQLLTYALSQIKDQNLAKDIKTTFSLVSINAMSADTAQEHIKQAINKSYNKGASWNGDVIVGAVVFLVIIAGALVLVGQNKIEDGCYKTYQCNNSCSFGVCNETCGYECI